MKKLFPHIMLATCLGMLSTQALAQDGSLWSFFEWLREIFHTHSLTCGHLQDGPPTSTSVPELDALNAGLAVALTGCIIAVFRERRKNR